MVRLVLQVLLVKAELAEPAVLAGKVAPPVTEAIWPMVLMVLQVLAVLKVQTAL